MRRTFRILAVVLIGVATLLMIAVGIIFIFFPMAGPAPVIHIKSTPERIAHGNYIFNTAAACVSCHSQRNESLLTMPLVKGTEGAGGEVFNQRMGFPGSFTAKNLTPAHLSNWTDGEIYRAIVCGVSKNGSALFPLMPYESYAKMDTEDIYSVIAYLRTLRPVTGEWPAARFDFPMNFIVRLIPKKNIPPTSIDTSRSPLYGEYLVNMASCKTCHTQANKGKIIEELAFGGGRDFALPTGGTIHSANITPNPETGIGTWTRQQFVQRFQGYNDTSFHPSLIAHNQFNTIMPWTLFARLKTSDLSAIYDYLRTVKPIKNSVTKFSPGKRPQ
jgi:hypothetical protein